MKKTLILAFAVLSAYIAQSIVRFVETRLTRNELNAMIAKEPEFSGLRTQQQGLSQVYVIGTLRSKKGATKLLEEINGVLRRRALFTPRVFPPDQTGYLLRQNDEITH